MFYSHQLLARKAPLGQIWMAATMHAKINRRKLDKLNIIKICEEILNPSVPMALRLSGILMGGVVIVYERKVKLLYDDVSRLLVEINEAWRVKTVPDPTVLPKGKNQAKYEAVTLPDAAEMEIEQSMLFSNGSATGKFHRNGFRMQLDDLEDDFITIDPRDPDVSQHHHQADKANITLFDDLESCMAETDLYNRFERFDIEDEEDPQFNFTQREPKVPSTLALSQSPPQAEPPQADGIRDNQKEEQEEQHAEQCRNEAQVTEQDEQRPRILKRKGRAKLTGISLDDEQLIIPGSIYQTWLQDTSDVVTKQRKIKQLNPIFSGKIGNLMELPPTTLMSCLENFPSEVYYPAPLMELWRKCTRVQTSCDSSSGERSSKQAQTPSSHSLPEAFYPQDLPEYHAEDFHSEMRSQTLHGSVEKLRADLKMMDFQGTGGSIMNDHLVTPGSPGRSVASNPSSGSGHTFLPLDPEVPLPSGRSKRRQHSSSANSFGNLDPVEEEAPLHQNSREFKLRRLSEKGPTPDFELLEETGPTQTPHPMVANTPIDKITESIRSQLKVHFDTPGAPVFESLDQLAFGMNRKRAAQLFYQTCVLATFDFVKVQQTVPYGDISISRGAKM